MTDLKQMEDALEAADAVIETLAEDETDAGVLGIVIAVRLKIAAALAAREGRDD